MYKVTQSAEITGVILVFTGIYSHRITFRKITTILLLDNGFGAYPSDSELNIVLM